MFPIHQVTAPPESLEQLGTKPKFWFRQGDQRILFKAEERGTGEDWAEKVACELARLLGMPHAEYDLAYYPPKALHGVICPNFVVQPSSLVLGNQLLHILDADYPAELRKKFGIPKYTVESVATALGFVLPPTWPEGVMVPASVNSALGTFVGYVMLDVWIANQDRHHLNWGVLGGEAGVKLAPTFDHGSSLGRNLTDKERQDRLTTKDRNRTVDHYVSRAVSEFYPADGTKPLPLIDVFRRFAALDPIAAKEWLSRLEAVSRAQIDAILEQVPAERMSEVTRQFTGEMLTLNRIRLLEGHTA